MAKRILLSLLAVLGGSLVMATPDVLSDGSEDEIENIRQKFDSLYRYSKTWYYENQFQEAIACQEEALKIAHQLNDTLNIAKSYHQIATSYCGWDKFKIGIQYYFKAQEMYQVLKDTLWIAHEYNDIGYAFLYWEDYAQVIEFYEKALDIYKLLDIPEEIALVEANMGFAYSFWGKQDEAIKHHSSALEIYQELKDSSNFSKMYHGLGDAHRRLGKYSKALIMLNHALEFSLIYGDEFQQAQNRLRIAETHSAMEQFDSAQFYFDAALPGLKERNSGKWWKNYYEARYNFNLKQNNVAAALLDFQNYKAIEDSLFNQRLQSEIMEMKLLHETNEKEKAIATLKSDNLLASQQIKFQNRILIAVSIALVLIFGLLLLLYKLYQQRKKAHAVLVDKNKELVQREENYRQELSRLKDKKKKVMEVERSLSKSKVNEEERERILSKLGQLMLEKKIYLNPSLKLNDLSKKLKTNTMYLSQVINQEYGKNFNTFINEHRIKEAQRCILNGDHITLNLEGIAQKTGFANRVTFNAAFKKFTGVSPSFYIESVEQERA